MKAKSFMKPLFHSLLVALAVVTVVTYHAAPVYSQQRDEPLFPVVDGEQTFYIDRTGRVVLTVPYQGVLFSEGLARVTVNRDSATSIERANS